MYYYGQWITLNEPTYFIEGYKAREQRQDVDDCPYRISASGIGKAEDWLFGWLWHRDRCTQTSIFQNGHDAATGGMDYHTVQIPQPWTIPIETGTIGDGKTWEPAEAQVKGWRGFNYGEKSDEYED